MKIRFRTNLGARDATPLGLCHEDCQEGEECDVKVKVAELLCNRGIAEAAEEWPKVEAVPAKSTIAEKKTGPQIEAKEQSPKAKTTSQPQSKDAKK